MKTAANGARTMRALYNSGYSNAKNKTKWIIDNRELIDSVIRNVTGHKKPAHYLAYPETERNQF